MLRRKITDQLAKWKDDPRKKSLLVRGARQVGKTFIIDDFARSSYPSYAYVNFELEPSAREIFGGDLDVDTIIRNMRRRFRDVSFEPGRTLIFLDEIQSCPQARTAMKSFTMDGRFDVIASGSLLGLNFKEVSSYPVGYEEEMTLHPMDFEEFLWALGEDEGSIAAVSERLGGREPLGEGDLRFFDEAFLMFMIVGGMPEAVSEYVRTRDVDSVRRVQKGIVDRYRDDIQKYAYGADRNRARMCLDSVPAQLGRRFRYSDVGGEANVGSREYGSGLEWLYDSGIIHWCYNVSEPVAPLSVNRRFNVFKLYMWDTGLLMSMMDRGVAMSMISGEGRANMVRIAENAVAGILGRKGAMITYFEKKGGLEVDFVINTDGEVAAIEVKSGNNAKSKSLDSIMSARHGVPRGIKLESTNVFVDERGVEHYPLFAAAFIFEDLSMPR